MEAILLAAYCSCACDRLKSSGEGAKNSSQWGLRSSGFSYGGRFASTHIEYYKNSHRQSVSGANAVRCRDCLGLSALYQEAVDEFRQHVRKLSQASVSYEAGIFIKLFEQCEAARQKCGRARDNLFGHLPEQHEGA